MSRTVWAWAFYDFANSAFATVVLTAVFSVYFVKTVAPAGAQIFGIHLKPEALWGFALSASALAVLVLSPVLGAMADRRAGRKKFLAAFWFIGWACTMLLIFAVPGRIMFTVAVFMLANIGFVVGNSFYNAFMRDICEEGRLGRVSGFGFAMGYIGGGLHLALCLLILARPGLFGIPDDGSWPQRICSAGAGLWWLLFGLPFFVWVPEQDSAAAPAPVVSAVFDGARTVVRTIREAAAPLRRASGTVDAQRAGRHREIFKFLLAYLIYNDGVETVILMSGIFGAQALGMGAYDLALCFLMIQGVAFAGALVFGRMADGIGHKRSILATLAIFTLSVLIGSMLTSRSGFWVLGAVVGLVLGGSQAGSRSLLAAMVPRGKSAEFFGFFALAGKFSAVVGPAFFALVVQAWSLRAAVASLAGFFMIGGILLWMVRENCAEAAAPRAAMS